MRNCSIIIGLVLSLCASGFADDWPTYRHDNHRSGITNEILEVESLTTHWVHRAPASPQTAWPKPAKWDAYANIRGLSDMRNYDSAFHVAVDGRRLFYGSSVDDALHCLDTLRGKEIWRFFADGPIRIAPTVADGLVYFGSDDGHAYCVTAATGKLVWKFACPAQPQTQPQIQADTSLILNNGRFISPWPCRTGVLVENGKAYFGFSMLPWRSSYLCAVDAKTGKAVGPGTWTVNRKGPTLEGAMVGFGDRMVFPQGRVPPLLVRRNDGKIEGGFQGGGGSFVCATKDKIFYGPGNKTGWISASTGAREKKPKTYNNSKAAIVTDKWLYLLSNSALIKTDLASGKQIWKTVLKSANDLILANGVVFVAGSDSSGQGADESWGVIACRDADGKVVWRGEASGNVHGLAVAGGALFASTDTGEIRCYRAGANHPPRLRPPGSKSVPKAASPKPTAKTAPKSTGQPAPATPTRVTRSSRRTFKNTDKTLVGSWVISSDLIDRARRMGLKDPQRRILDQTGRLHATVLGDVRLRRVGGIEALELDGARNSVMVVEDYKKANLPTEAITVQAWVRVDKPLKWGGIIGAMQDNGKFERGWVLGYNGSKFSFAVCATGGADKLTYLTANTEFKSGNWYHVTGTYDSKTLKIYVNGKLAGTSTEQSGKINYPPDAFLEIGAYHDKDEYYRMSGFLHEASIYSQAKTAADIAKSYQQGLGNFPVPIHLSLGPYGRFTGRDTAEIFWHTDRASPTILEYSLGAQKKKVGSPQRKLKHKVTLKGLERDAVYHYVIGTQSDAGSGQTAAFELDTHFNYSMVGIDPSKTLKADQAALNAAKALVDHLFAKTEFERGMCLVVGAADVPLMVELTRRTGMRVVAVDTDAVRVAKARDLLAEAGLYGMRVTVRQVASLSKLPFTGNVFNLVVSPQPKFSSQLNVEAGRVLCPGRGVGFLRLATRGASLALGRKLSSQYPSRSVELLAAQPIYLQYSRAKLKGAGEWSHLYGKADNSGFGGESLGGARKSSDLKVQWIGRPGPRAQPDRNGRKPSPLAANGRLYVQGLHRLIGMDAYNGTILWSWEIPPLERFNMPRDCSNWCADDDNVFVAVRNRLWQIDGQTGRIVDVHDVLPGPNKQTEYEWGYIGRHQDVLIGSSVKRGAMYTNFWGKADSGWYDARSGPATFKVCSDQLFGLYPDTGGTRWTYNGGVVLNSTITVSDGKVVFVESRNKKIMEAPSRRIGMSELWADQYLVSLDVRTGKKIWEKPLDTADGVVVMYLAAAQGKLVIGTSADKKFHLYVYDAKTGKPTFNREFGWLGGKGDHGKAMSRPAIVGNKVFMRPMAFDLKTGDTLKVSMPGGGCGTYAATSNMFIFRSGNVTLWDTDTGKKSSWSRLRPGCWLSTIPANGMLLSPEAGGGCSCGSWMETSIGFIPVISDK